MMCCKLLYMFGFFSKQKTAYEMRISDCSSDVCSSDLKEIEPRRAKTYLITKGRSCPLCGAPHSGDHDAEYHGDLTEQHVRPLHDLASDFSCAFSSWKARHKDVPQASGSVTGQCRLKTVLSRKVAEKESMRGVARQNKTTQPKERRVGDECVSTVSTRG